MTKKQNLKVVFNDPNEGDELAKVLIEIVAQAINDKVSREILHSVVQGSPINAECSA